MIEDRHEKLDKLLDEFANILYILKENRKDEKKLFQKLDVLMNEMESVTKQIGGVLQEHFLLFKNKVKNFLDLSTSIDSMIEYCLKIKNDLWPL